MDIEVLRRAPLFASLGDDVFAALTDELTEVDLSRGASVFREGDQGDQLYFIVSGKIKLGRSAPDGRENLLAILGPGELFGEMALFDPSPRNATATAVSETRLAGLRHDNLKALLDLADRFGRPATDGILVAHELTQEELAQLVGASRETVNKALAEFVQRGWLRLEARAVVILDVQRLRQRSR